MMFPTHILMGGSLGLVSLVFFPDHVLVAVLAGMAGGLLPDIDMFWEHRKTFHRPFQFLISALMLIPALVLFSQEWIVALFFLFLSMAAHSWAEIFSNGKTMRPYQNPDDRAVYDHLEDRWIKPRRLVIMGSARDLVLTLFSGFLLLYFIDSLRSIILSVMLWGVLYSALNRKVKRLMPDDYDRFSQFFQARTGFGPDS